MASIFSWVDFSEEDRRRISEVIRGLDEQTRDELGVGVVRDSLAETLFPGTSTIQTRGRYLLFVPWIYLQHERRQTPADEIASSARKSEVLLIKKLDESDDREGIIGIDAQENLRRLPSDIYWAGLGTLGIRRFPGSRDRYHRSFDAWARKRVNPVKNDDNEQVESGPQVAWDPYIPPAPKEFPDKASFQLTRDEAEYLKGRIQSANRKLTLFSHLLTLHEIPQDGQPLWNLTGSGAFPDPLPQQISHARNFSLAIHGAAWLYNLMLSQKVGKHEWIDRYQNEFNKWAKEMLKNRIAMEHWDRKAFWTLVNPDNRQIGERTRKFIDRWLDLALAPNPSRITTSKEARDLIETREHNIKPGRARLFNQSYLHRWNGDVGAGIGRLDYRWFRVKRIAQDIIEGGR